MPARKSPAPKSTSNPKLAPEFLRTRDYVRRYCVLDQDELDITTVWAMGTWAFSPACQNPATYPYLYVAAPKGSGKTVLGQDVLGGITRRHTSTVGVTGAAIFRMIGTVVEDEETGAQEVVSDAPTLALDEIDATFSGAKDEGLRQMLNAGYKRGATVPRANGKTTINFPVYCPKVLMGIDNGHLPETVLDRSIRIDMRRASPAEMTTIEPFYSWDAEDEAAELSAALSVWAKAHSCVLREYRPVEIEGFQPRQWEIARSLVQLAREIGNEPQIREAFRRVMTKNPSKPDHKVTLYQSILNLFTELDEDRVTSNQILERLATDGVNVPGNSGKGLSSVLSEDGVAPDYIRMRKGHPGITDPAKPVQRGYFRHKFDGPFFRYLEDEEA